MGDYWKGLDWGGRTVQRRWLLEAVQEKNKRTVFTRHNLRFFTIIPCLLCLLFIPAGARRFAGVCIELACDMYVCHLDRNHGEDRFTTLVFFSFPFAIGVSRCRWRGGRLIFCTSREATRVGLVYDREDGYLKWFRLVVSTTSVSLPERRGARRSLPCNKRLDDEESGKIQGAC